MPLDDNMMNLPDLSAFQDAEKQHILNVLIRDENLRQQHLARFLNLRKEVADLEQQSQSTSTSICARCQTPFGYIFNTGDACPKCSAKVCKQCRLLYNLNDNGWLCLLCCKQMQLMSYSGEWIYSIHSNLRKNSATASDILNKLVSHTVSFQNVHTASSSDSESEDINSSVQINNRFTTKPLPTKSTNLTPHDPINKMIVQNTTDVQKLNFVKECIKDRPLNVSFTQPLSRRSYQTLSSSTTMKSSLDEPNSLNNHRDLKTNKQNSLVSSNDDVFKPNENDTDSKSIISSEQNRDTKSKNNTLSVKQQSQSYLGGSKLSLTSITATITTAASSRKHISASMQSLRDAVHRIKHPHLSSSHNSLQSDRYHQVNMLTINNEDPMSLKVPSISIRSNSHTNFRTPQLSIDELKTNHLDSTNIIDSIKSTNASEIVNQNKLEPIGYRESIPESEDDIDSKFEKAKSVTTKRANSFMDIRGSQISINSVISEAKARYELDITGTIQLKLSYNVKISSLDIFIKQCTNLVQSKLHQISNPYCKIYLLPDKSKGSKRKTTMKKGTTNPIFNEILRYHVSLQEFDMHILWISVWSQTSLTQKDFVGEIHIPLANCILDNLQEYTLQPRIEQENLIVNIEPITDTSELYFELTFIEHSKNKDIGTIQVNSIHGTGIKYGRHTVNAICKALLMPEKIKRKLPTICKGPSPKWDIPIRWENIRRENLKNISLEISIWNQERFRKTMIGFIRLNTIRKRQDDRTIKMLETTSDERSAWELFKQTPTKIHQFRLPLRSAINEQK